MAYNSTVNYVNLVHQLADQRYHVPDHIKSSFMGYAKSVYQSDVENRYSEPMVAIGVYIALASLCCILAMVADLVHGIRSRKLWIPCKYFTINAASLTVIAVAMKLPVDLTGPMPGVVDQLAKLGSMAFMCTMMANLLPSLAMLDSNALLANVTALGVMVITLVVNVCIQIRTGVVVSKGGEAAKLLQMISTGDYVPKDLLISNKFTCSTIAIIYSALLLLMFIMHVCSSIAVLKANQITELKYQLYQERASRDNQQSYGTPGTIERLEKHVHYYWTMATNGNPQYIIPCSVTITASGVICAFTTIFHSFSIKWVIADVMGGDYDSHYKWTTLLILIVQFIGVVLSTVAPLSRCIANLSFIGSFAYHIEVFKVEDYWTQKLHDWKYGSISLPFRSLKLKMIIMNLKSRILNFCIKFQYGVVVVCKILTFLPFFIFFIVVFLLYCLRYLKWLIIKIGLTIPGVQIVNWVTTHGGNTVNSVTTLGGNFLNWELGLSVIEFAHEIAARTQQAIFESWKQLIQKGEKKPPVYLMNLINEKATVDFKGVRTFVKNDSQNCWSLAVVTLTTIAITLPNTDKVEVDSLYKSVREGLEYVTLVEKFLNTTDEYVSIQRAAERLWQEVVVCHKWLGIGLKDISSQVNTTASHVDTTLQIVQRFLEKAKNNTSKGCVCMDDEPKFTSICANSMSHVTEAIIGDNENHQRLFDELSSRIADIMAACLTNLPQVIAMKCHTSAIEKREANTHAAAKLLGETKQIINTLQDKLHAYINMNPDDLPYIDKWRAYLSHP